MADSTLHKILDKLKALLEGSAGTGRTIAAGRYTVVSEDENTLVTRCIADPRPAYVVDGGDAAPSATLGDLAAQDASQHVWKSRAIQVFIAYGFAPGLSTPLARPTEIADDAEELEGVLTYDLNLALVDGWADCEASSRIILTRDPETGIAAIKWLVIDLTVSYWEERTP